MIDRSVGRSVGAVIKRSTWSTVVFVVLLLWRCLIRSLRLVTYIFVVVGRCCGVVLIHSYRTLRVMIHSPRYAYVLMMVCARI